MNYGGWGMVGNSLGMMGMGMMEVRLDHSIAKTGEIQFVVINWSKAMGHEMLVVAVENPNAPLPWDHAAAKVALTPIMRKLNFIANALLRGRHKGVEISP